MNFFLLLEGIYTLLADMYKVRKHEVERHVHTQFPFWKGL